MTTFRKVCEGDELWEGEMKGIEIDNRKILLLRHNGQVRAYADRCPHLATRLSEGIFADGTLTCSAHHWMFAADTGEGINPRETCLTRYDVRIEGQEIWIGYD